MHPAAITILALVAVATAIGLLWRARTGRVRATSDRGSGSSGPIDLDEVPPTGEITLLQFSTAVCAPCRPTRALLASLAAETPGVRHIDLDITDRADLASRFSIMQTPTTLILDGDGTIRGRIGGAPRQAELRAAVATLLPHAHPATAPNGHAR